ncbi:CotS family spore coat protein [Thermoflavimicrobium daqui]|uniref:CotS family spore coat protein n=1 Tax=Thermoflavimicrobium daqui TaxID=2137476 RepID=UPI00143CCA86|nr:CotS family spore coat protein [Thermoflavimicrobium daqui]
MTNQLVQTAIEKYNLPPVTKFKILHDTSRTFVLALSTKQKTYVLKGIYISEGHQQFILEVENHLRNKGIRIPRVIPTQNNKLYFVYDHTPYLLQEWVPGNPFRYTSAKSYQQIATYLGRIHSASLGYQPSQADIESSIDYWEEEYTDKLYFIKKWKRKRSHTKNAKKKWILKHIDFFLKIGKEVKHHLLHLPYFHELQKTPLHQQFLCHGDFHRNNVRVDGDEWYVIDWEFVRYDYPSRDMNKVIFKIMSIDEKWNPSSFHAFLSSYLNENPLTFKQLGLLYTDLAFPHYFYLFLYKKWYHDMDLDEVQEFIQSQQEKTSFMLHMMKKYI